MSVTPYMCTPSVCVCFSDELPGTPSKCIHKVLTLAEKVKVIEAVNTGLSNVKVATKFGCGRTQVANILLNPFTMS